MRSRSWKLWAKVSKSAMSTALRGMGAGVALDDLTRSAYDRSIEARPRTTTS